MGEYTAEQGDCLSSIADRHGFSWKTLWDLPENASLKSLRKDPNVLLPGDVVFIPDKRTKGQPAATEARHRFRKKGIPAWLRLQLFDGDDPRADEEYHLEVDGILESGRTDAEGRIEHRLPPGAGRARLLVGEGRDEYIIDLGTMDPVEATTGIQARLNNLGFSCGEVDGILGPATRAALRSFQKKHGLPETGEADDATRKKLVESHGS